MEANNDNIQPAKSNVSLDELYKTMATEAAGLYNQMITICTTFLGGTLVFYDKLFVSGNSYTLILLFLGWLCLVIPLPMLIWIRWQNVEAHRYILKYIKFQKADDYTKGVEIPKKSRCLTQWAIWLIAVGLFLISLFTAINISLDP
jgi:hypothetical protein